MSNPSEGKRYTTNKRETKKCIKRIKGEREREREKEKVGKRKREREPIAPVERGNIKRRRNNNDWEIMDR